MEQFIDFIWTFVVFITTLSLLPLLGLSYVAVTIIHNTWLIIISFMNPELEFLKQTTLRTLVDTHRNQGIITLLIKIKGQPEVVAIKRHIQELVNRKDKHGNLSFPRLRQSLVTRCGTYAWQRTPFDLEQNIIAGPSTCKGRPINDINIQDIVSEIVMKYLPVGIPPWQIVIIPTSENHHYLLFKLHHVLLNDNLNIADLLPLIPPVRTNMNVAERDSPLINVFKKPENIPYLKERLTEEFTNRWNEFISYYDPLERTELLKNHPGFFEYLGISIITTVAIFKETRKGFKVIKNDLMSKIKYIYITIIKESEKRKLTLPNFFISIFVTCNPQNLIKSFIKHWWYTFMWILIKLPLQIYYEFMATFSCIVLQYCAYPNTFVGNLYNYVPLFFYSFKEFFYCFKQLFYTPITVARELTKKHEIVETMTLCGRKVISWSSPLKINAIKEIAKCTKTSETEIIFYVMSAAFSRYFSQVNCKIPKEIPVLSRNINSNYIFLTGNRIKAENSINGMLRINLPILDSDKDKTILENLIDIKTNFKLARQDQTFIYLLSIMQTKYGIFSKLLPATFIGIVLKYLSKIYAVSFTEITTKQPNVKHTTIWGQEVENVIYWRPPQANNCISICLNEYADYMTLGVMCDAQLVPHHTILARGFSEHIEDLAVAVGIK